MKLKVGVCGVGHLGKFHVQQWLEIKEAQLIGFFDPNEDNAKYIIAQYGIERFLSLDLLLEKIDALDIVTPTVFHFEIAHKALKMGKHLFIEKPLAHTIEEAREMMKLAKEAAVKCQVGHVERFNPAFLALENEHLQPLFIEAHRLSQFNPRGTDVSVILDLMIHDIDIILHLVKSTVRRVSASGVAVMSETPDIANARIEFNNGCVANLTSSRISLKKMRKMRLFQKDAYISIDFLAKKTEIIRLKDPSDAKGLMDLPIEMANGTKKIISVQMPDILDSNAIRRELTEFTLSILNEQPIIVTLTDGYAAMDIAHQILEKMNHHSQQKNN